MPWKVNGERWHLSDKGFPPGRKVQWDRTLLPRVLDLLRTIVPDLEVQWDVRDSITVRIPGISRAWAGLRTKAAESLDVKFLGPKGQFNLSLLEGLGESPEILSHREDIDALHFTFRQLDPNQLKRLHKVMAEHAACFRVAFGSDLLDVAV